MMKAIQYAREKKVPYFGICLGLQTAVIEFARHVAGLEGANSTEFDEEPAHKVIFKLRDLIGVEALGGTMRLGKYPCELGNGSLAARAYGAAAISERHRHRYEVNQEFLPALKDAGHVLHGHVAGPQVRRDHRAARRPSLVPRLPVPPGAEVEAVRLPSALQGLHPRGQGAPGGARRGDGGAPGRRRRRDGPGSSPERRPLRRDRSRLHDRRRLAAPLFRGPLRHRVARARPRDGESG